MVKTKFATSNSFDSEFDIGYRSRERMTFKKIENYKITVFAIIMIPIAIEKVDDAQI
jgi:hypothetical protein